MARGDYLPDANFASLLVDTYMKTFRYQMYMIKFLKNSSYKQAWRGITEESTRVGLWKDTMDFDKKCFDYLSKDNFANSKQSLKIQEMLQKLLTEAKRKSKEMESIVGDICMSLRKRIFRYLKLNFRSSARGQTSTDLSGSRVKFNLFICSPVVV